MIGWLGRVGSIGLDWLIELSGDDEQLTTDHGQLAKSFIG